MAEDNSILKKKISQLEKEITAKDSELMIYRQELIKISQKLDGLMSQISQDAQLLAQVQKSLVPTELPNIPGFEFSRKFVYGSKIGGDYFDIFEHDDKLKFGLLLSSSSGYSMSALFLSLILKVSHVLEAKKGQSPEKIMQQIADEIKKAAQPQDQTSLFYAVIDRRDFQLQFCSAGRLTAYYVAPNKPFQILKSNHSPLGPQFDEKLSLARLDLEAKARLCVVSEGLGEVLTSDEITQIMTDKAKASVHDLRNEILFQAQRKAKTEEPLRDQTVIVIEVKDRVIKLAK